MQQVAILFKQLSHFSKNLAKAFPGQPIDALALGLDTHTLPPLCMFVKPSRNVLHFYVCENFRMRPAVYNPTQWR